MMRFLSDIGKYQKYSDKLEKKKLWETIIKKRKDKRKQRLEESSGGSGCP